MPIDPITHRKLVIVKQLYQQAIIHSSSFSMAGKIITLICFDCSIETVLNAVVGSLNPTEKRADTFPALVKQCEKLMSASSLGPIPDKGNILHVHSVRNDAQHEAKYPNDSDISDCRTYTRDFHNKLLNQLWGISLEDINLADLIQHVKVKQFLTDAEAALSKNDYVGAVENASAALSTALELVDSSIVGRKPSFISGAFMMSDGFGRSVKPDRDVFQAFKRMQQVLLYVSLGIRYSDYMRYHAIVGHTSFTMDGKHHTTGMKQPLEANDAEFVVSYCIDTIAQIEGQVGSLDAPFGKEHLLY